MNARLSLSGWGNYPVADCEVSRPERIHQLCVEGASTIARGLGRSYGDAATNSIGHVLMMERLDRLLAFDDSTGVLTAESGVSLATILDSLTGRGWFPGVVPGTKFVTLGGCIAADVHGKNHHRDGSFGAHVKSLDILLANGTTVRCSPTEYPELFWATVGGMGLTGIITQVTLQLRKVETGYMLASHHMAKDLDSVMAALASPHRDDHYSVAWIDCLAQSSQLGRSVLITAHHADVSELGAGVSHPFQYSHRRQLSVPVSLPNWVLNSATINIFNKLYYHWEGRRGGPFVVDYDRFFFPLDADGHWNRVYGKRGFVQYQCVIPNETASEGMRALLATLSISRRPSFLAVLKRFGGQGEGLLSFPTEGYTLALDIPVDDDLLPFLEKLDAIVLKYQGRVYLAKDCRLSVEAFRTMYPRYSQWLPVKQAVDPQGRFSSDLSRRLEIGAAS